MLRELTAETRRLIVNCRSLGMLGDLSSALAKIDAVLAKAGTVPGLDQIGLLSLKAELLYLDFKEEESLVVFETEIEPKLGSVKQEYRFVISQNKRNAIAAFRVADDREADISNDRQDLVGTKLWDAPAMVHAYESAFDGRHYEALPALWREVQNSYLQGTWSQYRQASKRLTREFLQIGWASLADFHAINSQNSDLVDSIANSLLAWRKPELTRSLVHRLIHQANLKRHSVLACKLLTQISDAIPEDQVAILFNWLLAKGTPLPGGESAKNLTIASWEALLSLTPRLTSDQAQNLVKAATSHESWAKEKADYLRPYLVQVVNQCVDRLPVEELAALAKGAVHMASGMSQDVNYDRNVFNLYRHISFRGDVTTKELIRDALYDSPSVNLDFVSMAKDFGKDVENADQVLKMAEHFTKDVRLQVQHLSLDQEPIKPDVSLAMATAKSADKKTAISIYVDMGLKAVIAHRRLLTSDYLEPLLAAVLDMLREPENILANKVLMINAITGLADTLTKEQAEEVFLVLEPMAKGNVVGFDVNAAFGDPNHPLNPFKMNLGEPATIHGGAIFALASIEATTPGVYGERLLKLIEEGMTNPNPEVRGLALMAARRVPAISDSAVTSTLLATRDNVPDVVVEAFFTLNNHSRETSEFWNAIACALKMATQSPDTSVRQAAALTIKNLTPKCKEETVLSQLQDLERILAEDPSFAVRMSVRSTVIDSNEGA